MERTKLGEFIRAEKDRRGMSSREFAALVEVSHRTIDRYLAGEDLQPRRPLVKKLSDKTGIPEDIVAAYAWPDRKTGITPDTLYLAYRLQQLPNDVRSALMAAVSSQE